MMKKNFEMFCDTCGKDRMFVRKVKEQTLNIRGEEITAAISLLQCPVCKDEQPDPASKSDPLIPFYREYRRRRQLLQPEEITEIRNRYRFSHEAFAALLGMSPATLYRYEGGALQDEVHDSLIALCDNRRNMVRVFLARKDRLKPLQLRRAEQALGNGRMSAAGLKKPA